MSRSDDRRGKEEYFKYHTWDWEFKGTPKPKKRMLFSNPEDQFLRSKITFYNGAEVDDSKGPYVIRGFNQRTS